MITVSSLTVLQLLENEHTRDSCIRFVCGIRKRIATADDIDSSTTEISRVVETIYHSIGAKARNEAFSKPLPSQPVPVLIAPNPPETKVRPAITWDDLMPIVDAFLNTDHPDEMTFTFSEIADHVEEEWTSNGAYEWNPRDLDAQNSNCVRWRNNVQSILQSKKEVSYSRRRKAWVIL